MNYDVLLVDDDNIVLNGLKTLVDWDALGFTIVGEASDGLQAIGLIEQLHPQLVVTDIYMRYCDGIQLMQQVREKYPEIRFIVLSCYDNFDYARNALRLGAMNYLLKSNVVGKEELTEALTHVRENLDKSRQARDQVQELQKRLNLSMPRYRKQFLLEVLRGQLKDPALIATGLAEMNFDAGSPNFFLMSVQLEPSPEGSGLEKEIGQLDDDIVEVLSDIMSKYGASEAFCVRHALYYGLIELTPRGNLYPVEDRALSIAELIRVRIKNQLEQDVLVLMDQAVPVDRLPLSGERMTQALRRSMYLPHHAVLKLDDVFRREKRQPVISHYADLVALFFNQQEFDRLVSKLLDTAMENQYLPYFEGVCDDLAKVYHRFASEFVDPEDESEFHYVQPEEFLSQNSVALTQSMALQLFKELRIELVHQHTTSPKQLIREVIEYIENNYTRDISLEALAIKTNFNKYYICKRFKKETGKTITNFIFDMRIAKAKELLLKLSDRRKIYEIAQEVGFSDVSYFDRVFKKLTSETPREFLDRNRRSI